MSDQSCTYNNMPLLALRGLTVFPNMILHFDVGRSKSTKALEQAMVNDQYIFLVAQKDATVDDPTPEDLFQVGTISKVKQLLKLPGDTIRVLVEGINRGQIHSFIQEDPYFLVEIEETKKEEEIENNKQKALLRVAIETFEKYAKVNGKISNDTLLSIFSLKKPGQLADTIAANIHLELEQQQMILGSLEPEERLHSMIQILKNETDILMIQRNIQTQVKQNIDKSQREYYLREQLKVIQEELGDKEGIKGEIEEYKNKLKKVNPPKEVEKKIQKELDRMLKIPYGSSEGTVVRNYIEWVLDLPWSYETEESHDLKRAETILNNDHFGLEKVKERIIEYLAVRQMDSSLNSPILCLVGPPGVGKTSIAASIAKALNRKYVRISLGGLRDEAEIRGHRRTYVGAMPGRIIQGLKQAETKNPLILLDEIDKMSSDFRGDPSSALLEVLDAEQNHKFRDHFIELPYDLSKVLFLATANTLQTIPRPLLDRLEIIHVSSYTEDEKLRIAMDYLLPKQVEKHGLQRSQLRLNENVMKKIIQNYTKEAGVRNLERTIGDLCRKAVKEFITQEKMYIRITEKNLERYLGIPKYHYDRITSQEEIGVARGLAWTSVGGDTLSIEVNTMKGTGKFELTGNMGNVMKESAKTAISYIRSKAVDFGIKENFYKNMDIHIHIPEGAVPKDGPSAGITMATAIISALTNIPIRNDLGMTGEITLRGRVLPIGGLKEKLLAARRAGIQTVLIPIDNQKDIEEISEHIYHNMNLIFVKSMDEVVEYALITPIQLNKESKWK